MKHRNDLHKIIDWPIDDQNIYYTDRQHRGHRDYLHTFVLLALFNPIHLV